MREESSRDGDIGGKELAAISVPRQRWSRKTNGKGTTWKRTANTKSGKERANDGKQFNSRRQREISRRARLRDCIRRCVCVRVNNPTRLSGNAKWRTLVSRCVWRRVCDYTGYDVWSSDESSSSSSSSTGVSPTRRNSQLAFLARVLLPLVRTACTRPLEQTRRVFLVLISRQLILSLRKTRITWGDRLTIELLVNYLLHRVSCEVLFPRRMALKACTWSRFDSVIGIRSSWNSKKFNLPTRWSTISFQSSSEKFFKRKLPILDRPQWKNTLATMISGPVTAGFLLFGSC